MIIIGNALEEMKKIKDESIDCIITSPPYWALRDYQTQGQIGQETTIKEYIKNLVDIFNEAKRVLKNDGTCWVNISDTYAGDKTGKTDRMMEYIPNQNIKKRVRELPRKSLCNIPARFSIAMQDEGWILRNEIIWYKPNAMPSSVKDRFTVDFEKIYFFTKNTDYYFNQPKEPMRTKDISQPRGSKGTLGSLNGGRKNKQDSLGKATYTGFNGRYKADENLMRNKRTVWTINTQRSTYEHFAMFPKELVETIIEAGCKPQGKVLDMFLGSGTTIEMASTMNRAFVGIEINPEYAEIAKKRMENVQISIFGWKDE
jgi:site-specific DNA-methyltransferase (adenine-specific)